MFTRLKISHKLWLLTTGVILVMSLGFYFYFNTIVEGQFREGLLKKGMGLVQTTAVNLGSTLYFNEDKSLKNILNGLENDPDVEFIYLIDRDGKLEYGYHYRPNTQSIKEMLASNQIQTFTRNNLILKQSIFFHDEFQGDIVLGLNLRWVDEKVAEQTRNLLFISLGLALLLILLSSIIARAISKPLKDAATTIGNYSGSEGVLNIELPVKGKDEFSQLAKALNQLSRNLNKNMRELNDSKKYLETLFQLSPIPIIISDTLGQIEGVNESASNYFGIEHSVLTQMNLDRFFQGDDLNAIFNRIIQEMQDVRGFVTTLKMTDGAKKVVELNIASHQDEFNYVKNIIIAIIDITEKIQIQREILHNQTKLQNINAELVQKTEEAQRLSDWNKRNANNLAQLINISQEIMRAATPNEILEKIVQKGRTLLDAEECVIYLWNKESQSLVPSLGAPSDVIDRISTKITNNGNLIWKTHQENDSFVRDSDELKFSDFETFGLDHARKFSLVSVPISEKDYHFGVIVFLKHRQHEFRVEDVHLLSTLANQAAILLDNLHLMQAIKEKAQSLEKAYGDLQTSQQQVIQLQKMESLGTLVGGIAHDFNNILGIIIPNTDLIRKDAGTNKNIVRRINIIADAAQRAADLTRQLLMFSRNQDIQVKVLNLNELLTRLSSMFKRTLGKEYDILLDLDPEVEAVEGDETRLTQVMVNLAVNARDAMPEGGEIIIRTRMRKFQPQTDDNRIEKEYVCISIKDNGCGIESGALDKIFDPFFTTKTVGKGTGLGLSVVYGIIKSHNGFIDVESSRGKGSTFNIYFPPSRKKLRPPETLARQPIPEGNEKILVVDDEDLIRDSIKEILESFGYRVSALASGVEAVQLVEQKQNYYQLAIVDKSMPKMNGIDTIRKIRDLDPSIKIILSSGHLDRDKAIPSDLKLDDTLPKPYRMRELAMKVRQVLNEKQTPVPDPQQ